MKLNYSYNLLQDITKEEADEVFKWAAELFKQAYKNSTGEDLSFTRQALFEYLQDFERVGFDDLPEDRTNIIFTFLAFLNQCIIAEFGGKHRFNSSSGKWGLDIPTIDSSIHVYVCTQVFIEDYLNENMSAADIMTKLDFIRNCVGISLN